ncbi:MAG: putative ABC transporter ATP-binding protein YfiL [Promethearchaeota archaeon]|nr:MAG: putative ABC transporter ATP-binding protein YfiL [Candidatus Lokiarchaeota archaeon]
MKTIETIEKNTHSNDITIEVKDLKKHFEDVKAVDGISFKIKKGECFGFLGPNGAGKTTTINILSCYLDPTSGNAKVGGFDVVKEARKVKELIGIAPQENIFYEELRTIENVMFFGEMYLNNTSELKKRAVELIEKVGLKDKQETKVEKLSGGMKRRLNLIIGLVHEPEILFLDEPTAGLDPQSRRLLWDYIEELKSQGKTIFLTTHYMDEADILSDRLAIIDHGKIIAHGTPEHLKETIGKGDLLNFKLEGTQSKIEKAIEDIKNSGDVMSADYFEEELITRVTAMDGIGKIGKFIKMFTENNLQITDIDVQRNSLENVFLALTGRSLRE